MALALLGSLEDSVTFMPGHKPLLHPSSFLHPGFLGTETEHLPLTAGADLLLKEQPFPTTHFPTHPHPLQRHHPRRCGSREMLVNSVGAFAWQCQPDIPPSPEEAPQLRGAAPTAGGLDPETSESRNLGDLKPALTRLWDCCLYKALGAPPGCRFTAPACGPWIASLALLPPPPPPPPVLPGSTAFTWL